MDIKEFKKCLPMLNFVDIEECTYYTDTKELVNNSTKQTTLIKSVDELLQHKIGDTKISEIISNDSYSMLFEPCGGRGQGSAESGRKEFKFDHASGGGGKEKAESKKLFPSMFNDGEKVQSINKAIGKFAKRHGSSDIEYGITVDSQGFVHSYKSGGSTSVRISARNGQTIIHNHPNSTYKDLAFSDTDLKTMAQSKGSKGIVATGKNSYVSVTKTDKFNGTAFAKAMASARPKGNTYSEATHNWLTENQKNYGYKYEKKKI